MGSAQNDACAIDSIAQTWGILSGAADPARARQAMKAVDKHLVRHEERLILLFTPPFDHSSLDPGYVKGYLPGVRENGGQYTHAATWVMQAAALLGQGRLAFQLLQIICPILHAEEPAEVERYRVEPYVVAADVYSRTPHVGRGGWTWYYRVRELVLSGDSRVDPRFSAPWRSSPLSTVHTARVVPFRDHLSFPLGDLYGQGGKPIGRRVRRAAVWLDSARQPGNSISLADDNSTHEVRVVIGQP